MKTIASIWEWLFRRQEIRNLVRNIEQIYELLEESREIRRKLADEARERENDDESKIA